MTYKDGNLEEVNIPEGNFYEPEIRTSYPQQEQVVLEPANSD